MHITHLAIWVTDLAATKAFYETYFGATAGDKYHNPTKGFSSYFLSFDSGARLEIMHKAEVLPRGKDHPQQEYLGIAHLAMAVGSKTSVDELTQRLAADGYAIIGAPRTTGDGYYESVVLDPEGNRVEITI